MNNNKETTDNGLPIIADRIILLSAISLLITAIILVIASFSGNNETTVTAEKFFTAVIPLVASWIGAIVAFYFSGSTFNAATDKISKMASLKIHDKLNDTLSSDVMIPLDEIKAFKLSPEDEHGNGTDFKKDIIDKFSEEITRVPIIDHKNRIKYIIHKSLAYEYLSSIKVQDNPPSLNDFISYNDNMSYTSKTIAFIKVNSKLSEAKIAMDHTPHSQDIIITIDGKKSSPVIGWITNVLITEHLYI